MRDSKKTTKEEMISDLEEEILKARNELYSFLVRKGKREHELRKAITDREEQLHELMAQEK